MEEADWDTVLDVNLKGAWNCCRAVVRPMMKQRYGRIVNISSVSGLAGQAGQTNYSASKAGLIGLTRLARALAPDHGEHSCAASPTDLTKDLPLSSRGIFEDDPLGRWGSTQDIAALVAFLASNEAAISPVTS
jgi:3-oxoacyl-[acyl-carrier protein] reductase